MKASADSAANAEFEALRQHGLHAMLGQQPDLCRRQGETERAGVRHEEAARMGLEGERDQRRAERRGALAGMRQQRLVAAMHAVEIAERDGAALPLRRRRPPVVEDRDHFGVRRGTETTASPSITTVSPLTHCVFSVTRRRSWLMSVMVQIAVTVSPIDTGAVKLKVCET